MAAATVPGDIKALFTRNEYNRLLAVFSKADKNRDGVLNHDETKALFQELDNFQVEADQIENILHGMDQDGDGQVSFEEFLLMVAAVAYKLDAKLSSIFNAYVHYNATSNGAADAKKGRRMSMESKRRYFANRAKKAGQTRTSLLIENHKINNIKVIGNIRPSSPRFQHINRVRTPQSEEGEYNSQVCSDIDIYFLDGAKEKFKITIHSTIKHLCVQIKCRLLLQNDSEFSLFHYRNNGIKKWFFDETANIMTIVDRFQAGKEDRLVFRRNLYVPWSQFEMEAKTSASAHRLQYAEILHRILADAYRPHVGRSIELAALLLMGDLGTYDIFQSVDLVDHLQNYVPDRLLELYKCDKESLADRILEEFKSICAPEAVPFVDDPSESLESSPLEARVQKVFNDIIGEVYAVPYEQLDLSQIKVVNLLIKNMSGVIVDEKRCEGIMDECGATEAVLFAIHGMKALHASRSQGNANVGAVWKGKSTAHKTLWAWFCQVESEMKRQGVLFDWDLEDDPHSEQNICCGLHMDPCLLVDTPGEVWAQKQLLRQCSMWFQEMYCSIFFDVKYLRMDRSEVGEDMDLQIESMKNTSVGLGHCGIHQLEEIVDMDGRSHTEITTIRYEQLTKWGTMGDVFVMWLQDNVYFFYDHQCAHLIEILLHAYVDEFMSQTDESSIKTSPSRIWQETDLRQLFEKFDLDKSGVLEQNEIQNLLVTLGKPISGSKLLDVMKAMDTSGAKTIGYEQFKEWWTSAEGNTVENRKHAVSEGLEQSLNESLVAGNAATRSRGRTVDALNVDPRRRPNYRAAASAPPTVAETGESNDSSSSSGSESSSSASDSESSSSENSSSSDSEEGLETRPQLSPGRNPDINAEDTNSDSGNDSSSSESIEIRSPTPTTKVPRSLKRFENNVAQKTRAAPRPSLKTRAAHKRIKNTNATDSKPVPQLKSADVRKRKPNPSQTEKNAVLNEETSLLSDKFSEGLERMEIIHSSLDLQAMEDDEREANNNKKKPFDLFGFLTFGCCASER